MRQQDFPKVTSAKVMRMLRVERIRRGISMNRLAGASGVSQSMISLLERELRVPTLETLLRLALGLDVDLWRLLQQASSTRKTSHKDP